MRIVPSSPAYRTRIVRHCAAQPCALFRQRTRLHPGATDHLRRRQQPDPGSLENPRPGRHQPAAGLGTPRGTPAQRRERMTFTDL